jgi:hypothetical protein
MVGGNGISVGDRQHFIHGLALEICHFGGRNPPNGRFLSQWLAAILKTYTKQPFIGCKAVDSVT